jgi:hypothetical protein
MRNAVPAPSGVRVYVRTPRKSPSGMPPVNSSRDAGSNAVTRTGNARPGAASVRMRTVPPGAIAPSTAVTPESQEGQDRPSTSTLQTSSALAAIVAVDS